MEWYLSGDDASGVRTLRRQIGDYLTRHARPGSDVSDAELVVAELLANAVEHADGPVWVRLTWPAERPDLEVFDLGPGFTFPEGHPDLASDARVEGPADDEPDLLAEGGRGLFLVTHLADDVAVFARTGRGSRVVARLPVRRAPTRSIDPPAMPQAAALPELGEADPSGAYGRDAFLRALVVQLTLGIEHLSGPDAGEAGVAAVGMSVGAQMEAAYRAARPDTGAVLSTEELADCFVRLKAAIGGGFQVVEVSADRVVLANTRCPFGDAVHRAPSLCRMTSTVFGGIAARNHPDGASVALEERIAVGDPGCRVVVHLGVPPDAIAPFAHRYRADVAQSRSLP